MKRSSGHWDEDSTHVFQLLPERDWKCWFNTNVVIFSSVFKVSKYHLREIGYQAIHTNVAKSSLEEQALQAPLAGWTNNSKIRNSLHNKYNSERITGKKVHLNLLMAGRTSRSRPNRTLLAGGGLARQYSCIWRGFSKAVLLHLKGYGKAVLLHLKGFRGCCTPQFERV